MPNSIVAELQANQWAMEPAALKAFIEQVAGLPDTAVMKSIEVDQQSKKLKIRDGVAVISISGVLLKTVPSWMRIWGIEATGYDEIRSQIKQALEDDEVEKIHLQVDSPGGEVAGGVEAADAIFNARNEKPVTATIEDLGASGAYWLSSQAQTIDADRNTIVGSIGVFCVYVDYSEAEAKAGIKVIVIRHGEHKGMSIDGITENQIKPIQKIIDAMAENFIAAVATGRDMDKAEVRKLATGELWIAKKAKQIGLIDTVTVQNQNQNSKNIKGVKSMEDQKQINELAEVKAQAKVESERLAEAQSKAKAEAELKAQAKEVRAEERKRLMEFKEAFPDDLEFAIDACGRGLSVTEAKAERFDVVSKQLAEATKKNEKAEVKEKAGVPPISNEDTDSQAEGDFMAEARQLVADGKAKTMTIAMRKISRSNPGLHRAYQEKCETVTKADYGEAAA